MSDNPKINFKYFCGFCVTCGMIFPFHKSRKDTAKCCSPECDKKRRKGQKAWNKGLTKEDYSKRVKVSDIKPNKCLNCGKPVKNKFCNHSCQKSYNNKQMRGKTYEELYGETKALEIRSKQSKSISKTANETGFTKIGAKVNGDFRRGKSHKEIYGEESERIRKDISNSIYEFLETPRGLEVRKAASDRGILLALSGKEFANTKKGYYKGVYFGSSLEKSFLEEMFRLLGTLKNVKRNESKIVPKGNGFRKTAPDYLIVDGNEILAYIEVKSTHLLKKDIVFEKAEALYEFGKENVILTGYFTQDTLVKFEKLQDNLEPRRLNSLLSYMEKELHNYVVSRKVQRLDVEDEKTNKTSRSIELGSNTLNDPLPNKLEDEIVRHPTKVGRCND